MNTLFLIGEPKLWDAPLTYLILAITVYTSYRSFEDYSERDKLIFHPHTIQRYGEWYRFFSHGLIHGDWIHLLFNAFVLYMFGALIEMELKYIFSPTIGPLVYLALYASGLIMSSLYSYYKHKDNPSYRALGASGAVSSVVFAFVLLHPTAGMGILLISDITGIYFPAFIFGGLYLAYSAYMGKQGRDNIAHDAHYWGAVWGFVFLVAVKPSLLILFLEQIRMYLLSFF